MTHEPRRSGRLPTFARYFLQRAWPPSLALPSCSRKMLRCVRESQAEGWQVTSAQVTSGDVTVIHGRFLDYAIANVGYAYSISDAYYSGYVTRQFWDEQRA